MGKRILLALIVAIAAIGGGVAIYVYTMIEDRPPLSDTTMDFECQFTNDTACKNSEAWLIDNYQNHPIPSISAQVTINGSTVWRGVIGYADLSNEISATFETQYQIGSISKTLTAAAALSMQQQGLLDIERTFQSYVNDYASVQSHFTLRHLLSHQSGIRHYYDELAESLNETAYRDTRDAVSIVEFDPLLFAPGDGFQYSSYAYSLIALAMENASNQSYDELMKQYLLMPLELKATELNLRDPTVNQASPYLLLGNSLFHAPLLDYSNKYAGAGYLSTPSDLAVFANALLDDKFFSESSKRLFFTPLSLSNGEMNPQNYALGIRVDNIDGKTIYYHGGMINGGYSFLSIFPEQQAVVVFTMNAVPKDFSRMQQANTLLNYFLLEK